MSMFVVKSIHIQINSRVMDLSIVVAVQSIFLLIEVRGNVKSYLHQRPRDPLRLMQHCGRWRRRPPSQWPPGTRRPSGSPRVAIATRRATTQTTQSSLDYKHTCVAFSYFLYLSLWIWIRYNKQKYSAIFPETPLDYQ